MPAYVHMIVEDRLEIEKEYSRREQAFARHKIFNGPAIFLDLCKIPDIVATLNTRRNGSDPFHPFACVRIYDNCSLLNNS